MPTGIYKRTEGMNRLLRVPHKGSGVYKRTAKHLKDIKKNLKIGQGWNKGKDSRIVAKCITCGKESLAHPSRKKRFCSFRCSVLYHKGENCYNWKGGLNYWNVRNNRKRDNGGSHTLGEWENLKAQYNWACPNCKKQIELVRDHIIPLAKGGSDNIENIQPLCRSCNAKKHITIFKYEK